MGKESPNIIIWRYDSFHERAKGLPEKSPEAEKCIN